MITVEDTTSTYSGRAGCMCGCLGNYNETPRARKTAITQMLKDPTARLDIWENGEGVLHSRTRTRTRVLYLTATGVSKLAGQFPLSGK